MHPAVRQHLSNNKKKSPPRRKKSPSPEPPAPAPAPALAPEPVAPPSPEPAPVLEEKQAAAPSPWLAANVACSVCGKLSATKGPHGVVCWHRRKNGSTGGCGKGVCWLCMESLPRSKLGMVRTSKDEFESLEDEAWWMHEACMGAADLREYFGGEKELALARQAADEADKAKTPSSSSKAVAVDPAEAVKEKVRVMSVKELKAYLDRHQAKHEQCVEKADLLNLALLVAETASPEIPDGPAWMPVGMVCRLCTKPTVKEHAGIICRRKRADGSIGGCGEGVCWRCMKRAPRESFGKVRTTKEEFESLEEDAWWMHEMCFEDADYKDYYGESEPEEDKAKRWELRKRRLGEEGDW